MTLHVVWLGSDRRRGTSRKKTERMLRVRSHDILGFEESAEVMQGFRRDRGRVILSGKVRRPVISLIHNSYNLVSTRGLDHENSILKPVQKNVMKLGIDKGDVLLDSHKARLGQSSPPGSDSFGPGLFSLILSPR